MDFGFGSSNFVALGASLHFHSQWFLSAGTTSLHNTGNRRHFSGSHQLPLRATALCAAPPPPHTLSRRSVIPVLCWCGHTGEESQKRTWKLSHTGHAAPTTSPAQSLLLAPRSYPLTLVGCTTRIWITWSRRSCRHSTCHIQRPKKLERQVLLGSEVSRYLPYRYSANP